jgi:hypothetical protein
MRAETVIDLAILRDDWRGTRFRTRVLVRESRDLRAGMAENLRQLWDAAHEVRERANRARAATSPRGEPVGEDA